MFEESFLSTGIQHNTFHMESIASTLQDGMFLQSGTLIGKAGNTGFSFGAHVHTEMVLSAGYIFGENVRTGNTAFTNLFLEQQIGAPSLNSFETTNTRWNNSKNFHFDNDNGWKNYYFNLNNLYGKD